VSELLKVEGVLESVEPLITSNTKREFWLVRLAEAEDVTYSTFDKKIMEKLEGNEGKAFEISYKKSADGKWNNIVSVAVKEETETEKDNQAARILATIANSVSEISAKLDKLIPKEDKPATP